MARLIFLAAARREIAEIAGYIERESASRAVAETFVDKPISHCEHLSQLPGEIGRARPELGKNYRSIAFGNYVLFIRYGHEDGLRSRLYIVHVVHGARDLDMYFSKRRD